jgi:hypothetical protein
MLAALSVDRVTSSDNRPEVATVGAVATVLGLTTHRADQLTRVKGFPEPLPSPDGGNRVWLVSEVREWARQTGRKLPEGP